MLIAPAPRSAACTIERAIEPSERSVLTTISRQSRPAPTIPAPLSPAAQASDATCVPCPFASASGGPPPGLLSLSAVHAGVDDRDGGARAALEVPRGRQAGARDPPLQHRAGRRPRRGLGRRERGVVGDQAQLVPALGLDEAHAR
jgi:hypothetical protein